jgi:8-oxo-dGTP diphosphatase
VDAVVALRHERKPGPHSVARAPFRQPPELLARECGEQAEALQLGDGGRDEAWRHAATVTRGMALLYGWQHCPRCASPLENDGARASCASCGLVAYANSAPSVSALVLDGEGRILLARRAHDPDAGLWDVPGGFLDEGEHPHDALRRELREETGLEAEPGRFAGTYMDTYGDGPGAETVLILVYEARVTSGVPAPADDVAELQWFSRDALPHPDACAFTWVAAFLDDWASGASR